MKQGDFTKLAKDYVNRPGYSYPLFDFILTKVKSQFGSLSPVADVGAGTGKLTEILQELGCKGFAVEPNDSMREEGSKLVGTSGFSWRKGSGEETGLENQSVHFVTMASSFHWTDPKKSIPEFSRILKPGGYLTVTWNPRDLERNELQKKIDAKIKEMVPSLNRVSSGAKGYTEHLDKTLVESGHFTDLVYMEAAHDLEMTPDRYLGVWRSVNDIQAQAGAEGFEKIMQMIEKEISGMKSIVVPYKTRAWTVRKVR
jgi:ubiquinone/menaquinone biosynthesis C-methylase UbiE